MYYLCEESGVKIGYEKEYDGFWFFFKRNVINDVTINVTNDDTINIDDLTELEKQILAEISKNPNVTRDILSSITGRTSRHIQRGIDKLKEKGFIERIGSNKTGYWKVND